jgi:hypothetical protein
MLFACEYIVRIIALRYLLYKIYLYVFYYSNSPQRLKRIFIKPFLFRYSVKDLLLLFVQLDFLSLESVIRVRYSC